MTRFILQENGSYLDSLSSTNSTVSKADLVALAIEHKKSSQYPLNESVVSFYNDVYGVLPQACKDVLNTNPIPDNWRDLING